MVTADELRTANGEHLGALLKELMGVIMQRSSGEMLRVMSDLGLSLPQMVTLQRLEQCGPHSISAIAANLNLSLAATSHLVDRMVQQGFVARNEDLNDRRHKSVAVTPAGRAVLDRLLEARVRDIDQVVEVLPAELRIDLQQALLHIIGTLKEAPLPTPVRTSGNCGRRKTHTV